MATNMALPGFGSLAAGRRSGYVQATLTVAGFACTMIFGLRFIVWALANWSKIYDPQADPIETFGNIWIALRWALLGIGLFAVSWLWSLWTSLRLVDDARRSAVPPRL